MKISKLEYENFRNFRGHGEIRCATDGKVTIVYGKNGDGKTTMHQLFQWVFYGRVHFNRTTTDTLYNLSFEREQPYGSTFIVMGRIDFEHDGHYYSLTRTCTFKKGLDDSAKVSEELQLNHKDDEDNWIRMDKPKDIIEKFLPSGLSEYFFFDGESMIADLRVKGKDSAGKLRKALYSMFDLDVIESALEHIGRTDLKTTVLGQLFISKGENVQTGEVSAVKTNIENAQQKIKDYEETLNALKQEKEEKKELITSISEKIGTTKSRQEYESQRRGLKTQRELFLNNAGIAQRDFGDAVIDNFPQLLISKAVADAKGKINLKIEKNRLPHGLSKRLVAYLLAMSTKECICGNPLCDAERAKIREYEAMMPPKSYTSLYNEFTRTAELWGRGYDKEKLESYVKQVFDNTEHAHKCDTQIHSLDEEEKNSPDVEDLIVDRQNAENRISEIDDDIVKVTKELDKFNIYLKKQMKQYETLTGQLEGNEIINKKIEIMEAVRNYFDGLLSNAADKYSKKLQENIQDLINQMLTSKRYTKVSPEFSVRVEDSNGDESKSEGQFAVVSFAYIGGILKMLKDDDKLSSKEYPLILDGPFSKLDSDQRQNVINVIPKFAPQVILFSKDNLQDYFEADSIGRVWTLVSNDEKNIASVEEGFLWN